MVRNILFPLAKNITVVANALVGGWVLSFAPASESILPLLGSALLLYTAFVTGGVSYSEKTTDSWAKQVLIVSGAIKGVAAASALLLSLHFARDQSAAAGEARVFPKCLLRCICHTVAA